MSGHSVPRLVHQGMQCDCTGSACVPIASSDRGAPVPSLGHAASFCSVPSPRLRLLSQSPPRVHFLCPSDALSHPPALASHLCSASPFSLSLFLCCLTICFDACVRACLLLSGTKAHEEVLRRLKETSARTSAANDWTRGRVTLSIPCMASFPPFLPPTHRSPVP